MLSLIPWRTRDPTYSQKKWLWITAFYHFYHLISPGFHDNPTWQKEKKHFLNTKGFFSKGSYLKGKEPDNEILINTERNDILSPEEFDSGSTWPFEHHYSSDTEPSGPHHGMDFWGRGVILIKRQKEMESLARKKLTWQGDIPRPYIFNNYPQIKNRSMFHVTKGKFRRVRRQIFAN